MPDLRNNFIIAHAQAAIQGVLASFPSNVYLFIYLRSQVVSWELCQVLQNLTRQYPFHGRDFQYAKLASHSAAFANHHRLCDYK